MPEPRTCRRCGAAIPALAPRGACPACLLRDAVESGEPGSAPGSFGRSAPVSVGWGSTSLERADGVSSLPGGPDALSLLSRAYGEMPRVLLRDPADGPEAPVHAPSSDGAGAPGTPPARYQFFGEIARGGMGAILKGYDVEPQPRPGRQGPPRPSPPRPRAGPPLCRGGADRRPTASTRASCRSTSWARSPIAAPSSP